MNNILKYYNTTTHKTISKIVSDGLKSRGQKPVEISPFDMMNNKEYEDIYILECMKYNFNINEHIISFKVGDIVRITENYNTFEKKRSILSKDLFKIIGINGNIYILENTKNKDDKRFKTMFEIKRS